MTTVLEPDVLVVGGGPAGSSVAALLRKYSPSTRVHLVEKAHFPRHQIGESLIADANRLLADTGAYERVSQAGFVPKSGSTFVWGRDRTPWFNEFSRMSNIPGFAGGPSYQTEYTWHVRRHEYDQLLLDHARELGAKVETGVGAEIQLDEQHALKEVVLSDGRRVRPRFVVDATGQQNQIARRMRTMHYDPVLRNVAIYGYYEGARLDPAMMGTWEMSRVTVIAVDEGWIWYIPLAPGLVSVGVVTNKEGLAKKPGATPREYLEQALAGCAEVRPLLSDAKRVRFAGAESDVLVIRDYCYSVEQVRGRGWALCGDAAGFVDPILSVGCYLAHTAASRLAYTLNTILSGEGADEELCWKAYEEQLQFQLQAFRRMTYMFYGYNTSKESWWWEAHKILRDAALPASVEPRSAFLALSTGYGINRPVVHEAISEFGVNIYQNFYRHLVRDEPISRQVEMRGDHRYRHQLQLTSEPWMVPLEGTGHMRQVRRVTFASPSGGEAPPRLFLPESHWNFVAALEGRTMEGALSAIAPAEAQQVREGLKPFVAGLVNMGIVARG